MYVDVYPASSGLICVSFLCSGVQALPGMKLGSKFRLPQALLAGKGLGKEETDEECISTTSARRVVLFIPPPPRSTTTSAGNGTRSSGEKENTAPGPDVIHDRRKTKATSPQTCLILLRIILRVYLASP
jgi:hypothetical protein